MPTILTIAVGAIAFYALPATLAAWQVGAIAGAAGGFAGGLASGGGLKAALTGAFWGGVTGAVAGFIGHGVGLKTAPSPFGVAKNFVHGVSQGTIAKLRGGDFRSGFIGAIVGGYAGKVSNYFNGKISALKNISDGAGVAMRTAVAGVMGGISAKITGGRFEDGAVSAAFTWLFNHEAKSFFDRIKMKLAMQTPTSFRLKLDKLAEIQMGAGVQLGGEFDGSNKMFPEPNWWFARIFMKAKLSILNYGIQTTPYDRTGRINPYKATTDSTNRDNVQVTIGQIAAVDEKIFSISIDVGDISMSASYEY